MQADAAFARPTHHGERSKLRTVVKAQHRWRAALPNETLEHLDGAKARQREVCFDRHRLAREIFDRVEHAELTAAYQSILHEADRPALVEPRDGRRQLCDRNVQDFSLMGPVRFTFLNSPLAAVGTLSEMGAVALKTFGDVYREFVDHVDQKAADECGLQPKPGHSGELQPLHVVETGRDFTGKEARQLEATQILGSAAEQYIYYDEGWAALKSRLRLFARAQVVEASGLSRSQAYALLDESSKIEPEHATMAILRHALERLEKSSTAHENIDEADSPQ